MKNRRTTPAPAELRRRAPETGTLPPPHGTDGRRQRGFSMVEALIAAVLIGVAAIGIIPLFTRAMTDNLAGADYTRVTNYAKCKQEDFTRMPFTQPTIQVPAGQGNLLTTEYMDPASLQWAPYNAASPPANPLAIWTRTTTITQYNIFDTDDDQTFDYPLNGGAAVDEVQIMQAQVQVRSVSAVGPMGARRSTIIRFLKAF